MTVEVLSLDLVRKVEIGVPDTFDSNKPLLILAHGSGNNMNSAFLTAISEGVQSQEINVIRFNFPYKVAGKKVPDRSEVLENSWQLVIHWVEDNLKFEGLFIGGKSMGGRISTMVAAGFPNLKGLVFLGYPLHPPGKFDQVRDEYLYSLQIPMLFIQGTRDPFARMDLLQNTLSDLRERATLHWIEGGDHAFRVLVRQGVSYPDTLRQVSERVGRWIKEVQKRE
jgi:predicted alpha/beta-hydrolase family hydrolase